MNRGSAHSCVRFDLIQLRFNEAPIHESGKCGVIDTLKG